MAWTLEGACAFRSKVLTELNGFDPIFRRYQEGPDICKRALDAGYQVAMTSTVKTKHLRELGLFTIRHAPQFLRSLYLWYKKHYFSKA